MISWIKKIFSKDPHQEEYIENLIQKQQVVFPKMSILDCHSCCHFMTGVCDEKRNNFYLKYIKTHKKLLNCLPTKTDPHEIGEWAANVCGEYIPLKEKNDYLKGKVEIIENKDIWTKKDKERYDLFD